MNSTKRSRFPDTVFMARHVGARTLVVVVVVVVYSRLRQLVQFHCAGNVTL